LYSHDTIIVEAAQSGALEAKRKLVKGQYAEHYFKWGVLRSGGKGGSYLWLTYRRLAQTVIKALLQAAAELEV
jgi:hypothetical protein